MLQGFFFSLEFSSIFLSAIRCQTPRTLTWPWSLSSAVFEHFEVSLPTVDHSSPKRLILKILFVPLNTAANSPRLESRPGLGPETGKPIRAQLSRVVIGLWWWFASRRMFLRNPSCIPRTLVVAAASKNGEIRVPESHGSRSKLNLPLRLLSLSFFNRSPRSSCSMTDRFAEYVRIYHCSS